MQHRVSLSRKVFVVGNYIFLVALSLLCLLPLIQVLSISFSSSAAASAGLVKLLPVDITFSSYKYILQKQEFISSFGISFERLVLGFVMNMGISLLCAYPLSKERKDLRLRSYYAWFFVFTLLFSGGLIPTYIVVSMTGLIDTIWALIIPSAVSVFNVILLLNFFRGLPKEIEESAFMDGAGHWLVLWKMYVPMSLPVLATVSLFTMVYHWNAWFDGLIYMNFPKNYPLSTYLQLLVINSNPMKMDPKNLAGLIEISERTTRAAQIFMGALPILIVYPFLQKFFVKGIVLGSVKG
ncbi:putative ABC transporter permease protein YtcP [Paenibacillus baekrokdamisoli]|uniref:Putative ABC transporter permease protein YtcP n=1 Tax=Paenibacillus baekrokdamisoli TaxID=1712516 RepID=A0A3G9J2F0_9BACL|nr:carbohydrate ABC transporter permease [Paenibacillus baekrokdamisoli]MBB3069162.1 putative aldouronate transport system permease protein [Paenibacillus baekrokdamisoli]BBH18863.1 putative ABC transporter permease protein YtcP [Paenibacillus baekrokdamisoli]